MRSCPVCDTLDKLERKRIFSIIYKIPDGWPLPTEITWYTCKVCGMCYGDGDMTQDTLNEYYQKYYGYGVNSPDNIRRLKYSARFHAVRYKLDNGARVLDFGGAGDDGDSVYIDEIKKYFADIEGYCTGAGEELPANCDVIYASHVLEHVYNLPDTMKALLDALAPDGILVIDGPDAANINPDWPILDYNTKHINHFTLTDYLWMGQRHGLTAIACLNYPMSGCWNYQIHFQKRNIAQEAARHVNGTLDAKLEKLREIDYPVNVWGLGDITWALLSRIDLQVLDYIDNDPAYRGSTYAGKEVQERPTNDAPIVIMAQGQRGRLIENIRKAGITNEIVEI